MKQSKAIWRGILWTLLILLFPVGSGVLSAVLALSTRQTLLVQSAAMLLALVPPLALVLTGKWQRQDLGFRHFRGIGLWILPVLAIFIPPAVKGFAWRENAWGMLLLYGAVGLSEEVYFRGIIPGILKKAFSRRCTLWLSAGLFALGHAAGALSGMGLAETILTIFNALIFGVLALEMTALSGNIIPAVLVHFFFDFETKICRLDGPWLLTAEVVRGIVMVLAAVCLYFAVKKSPEQR